VNRGHNETTSIFFVITTAAATATTTKLKLRGLSPQANYTDRAADAGRRS